MKVNLRYKIIGLAILSALVPTMILLILLKLREAPLKQTVQHEIETLVQKGLEHIVDTVYTSCQIVYATTDRLIGNSFNVASYILNNAGPVVLSDKEKVTWNATNEYTGQTTSVVLPKFLINGEWPGQVRSFNKGVAVVDTVQGIMGVNAAIFQEMDTGGDLLCIGSTVPNEQGERSIGHYFPRHLPDGSTNPIVNAIYNDQVYRESAYNVNRTKWSIGVYKPLKDAKGEVVGAFHVSVQRQTVMRNLNEAIQDILIGKKGYVFILEGPMVPIDNALFLHSAGSTPDEIISKNSMPIYEFIRKKASEVKTNRMFIDNYSWADMGEENPSDKIIVYTYFPEWDWVIGVTAYRRDFMNSYLEIENTFSHLVEMIFIWGAILFVVIGTIAFIRGGNIANPITLITGIARKIAEGDLNTASAFIANIESTNMQIKRARYSEDETGDLFRAVILMIDKLNHLIGQVRKASLQLINTATNIDVTSKQQENTVKDFGSYTNQIAAAVKQISSTSQELYKTISGVSDVATETASMADAGLNELSGMEYTMQNLAEATLSISGKLSTITEKTKNITSVVTTISKVADQTNLLALNASIEAEKAGEFGMGFSVIANEIKHLADQTALATFDIEQMVKEMQSAVSAGVMEMDKFTDEVRSGVDEVGRISGRLEKIILQVQQLTPHFETVKEGMQLQSQGAQQINGAMVNLTDAAGDTIEVLHEFEKGTKSLHEAVDGLKEEVLKFKVLDNSELYEEAASAQEKSVNENANEDSK